VQEFALAREAIFLVGSQEIKAPIVEDAVLFGHILGTLRDSCGRRLPIETHRGMVRIRKITAIERLSSNKPSHSIPDHLVGTIVYMTEDHECSEPRDRILGILGFLEGHKTTELVMDKDTSVVDLYTNFSHYLLTHTDQSQIHWWKLLDRAAMTAKRAGLPSWCPDFHQQQNENGRNSICQLGRRLDLPYGASRFPGSIRRGGNLQQLVMRGTIFDHILSAHPITPIPPISIQEFASQIPSVELLIKLVMDLHTLIRDVASSTVGTRLSTWPDAFDQNQYSDHTMVDIFWRTLVGNTVRQADYTITYETFTGFGDALSEFAKLCHEVDTQLER
jgi:hypothetical protein